MEISKPGSDAPLKIFFAFLDELDYSTHFKKGLEIYLCQTPPPPPFGNFQTIYFFLTLYSSLSSFYLEMESIERYNIGLAQCIYAKQEPILIIVSYLFKLNIFSNRDIYLD